MRLPRNSRICRLEYFTMSSPLNNIWPSVILPGSTSMRIIEYAVTLLPLPDSPTMPNTLPRSRLNDTPLTARTSPDETANDVCRFFT